MPVIEVMVRDVPQVGADGMLDAALKSLQGGKASVIGVVDPNDRLVGYINHENIGELMMVRSATHG